MFCIPIISPDTDNAVLKMEKAALHADIFEIRLDLMVTFDLDRIIKAASRPLIITYRSEAEGGKGDAGPEITAGYLIRAAKAGADYVDIELSMPTGLRNEVLSSAGKDGSIISTHISDHTPSRKILFDIFRKSIDTGTEVIKIVTMANNWEDNIRVMELIPAARGENVKIIAFCMGFMGRISRIMSLLMGAYLGFSSIEEGEESAPGQMTISEMKRIMEYFQFNENPK